MYILLKLLKPFVDHDCMSMAFVSQAIASSGKDPALTVRRCYNQGRTRSGL
jgi:hypothetical protein